MRTKNKKLMLLTLAVVMVLGLIPLSIFSSQPTVSAAPDSPSENELQFYEDIIGEEWHAWMETGDKIVIKDKNKVQSLTLTRWGNEVALEILPPWPSENVFKSTLSADEKGKLQWKLEHIDGRKMDLKTELHDKLEYTEEINGENYSFWQMLGGGVSIDLKLEWKKETPGPMEINFYIKGYENLDFFYQPPLHPDHPTWADTDNDGVADTFRPSNIVGSYAVYHKWKQNYVVGETNYGTGKLFHIYRPKIIDYENNWVWGDLSFDENTGILTVTILQDWLETAKTPIWIDPTFGYETIGGTTVGFSDYITGTVFTCLEVGKAQAIKAYVSTYGGSTGHRTAIYKHSDSSLIAYSGEQGIGGPGWQTFNLAGEDLEATDYVLVGWCDGDGSTIYGIFYYDSGIGMAHYQDLAYDGFPNPANFSHGNEKYSIYVEYTVNDPPNPPTSLLCEGQINPTQIIDTQPEFSAIGTDNEGDNMENYALQVDDDSGFGSPIYNKTKTSIASFENNMRCSDVSYENSDLVRGTTYYWRIKFWDNNDGEGDWSTETATFVLNQLPTVPTNWTNLGMNLTDHTPAITWTKGTDGDGDTVTTYIFVGTTSTPTEVENSTTGESENIGENTSHSCYPLADGSTYYYRLRSWDGLEWSTSYTTADEFRMNSKPTLPTGINNLGMNLTDHTPDKTFTRGTDADGDTVYTVAYLGLTASPTVEDVRGTGTTLTLGENTSHPQYPLVDGQTYYVRLRSWDGYEWSDSYTADDTFRMNTKPSNPTSWTDLGMNLTDHTPTITWNGESDAEGDTVTVYVYVGTTLTPTTEEGNSTTGTLDLGSTVTLDDGTTYYYRLRAYDGYEWNNGYTASDEFRMNTPPTTTSLKTEGEIDPTRIITTAPTFSWTYGDTEGDTQSHWQIWVGTTSGAYDKWDSGEMAGTDNSDVYGGSALTRGETYYVQARTKDDYEWSTWATGTFRINQLPTQTYSEQTFYEDYTPTLIWSFDDADGDTQLGVNIQVDNDADFGSLLWDYSDNTTTVQSKVYAGDALEKEVTYYARVQVRDGYEWSGTWSENTFEILPLATLVVTEITVDNTPVDRKAHWAGDDDVRIYVTAKDNEGRDAIENAYFWIRDNGDTVVVDNVIHTGYENGDDENTKRFWYNYNPSNILLNSALGEFDVKVQVVSAIYENTKDYTDLGFELFTVDDHSVTFTPVREIYAEGEIITFEPTVKSVATGLAVDNAYLKLELISEMEEVLRTVSGYTNVSGKLVTHTTLLEADIGFYDVRISTSKGTIDGQKVYEDAFSVVAELPVSIESITPADDYVSGLLRSRSTVSEDVKVKIFVYDTTGTELLNLTSSTIRVENIAPQLQDWEVPYGLTLAEGTYSYRVEVWTADLGTMYHVAFAEIKLTVAPSQQPVGEWSCVDTVETKDGTFDVELYRESLVTNPTTVDKSNFYFREVVDAPQGSSVLVTVGGLPPTTLKVDKYGTIEKYFDIPASTTIKVGMEVTIISAVKVEFLGETEVVATASVPRTCKEYQYQITNLTPTVLRELKLTFPVDGVVLVWDDEGRSLDFWEGESTVVEIRELGSYQELTITLSSELPPSIDQMIERLITWVPFFGIPIVVFTLGAGVLLCLLTKGWAGIITKFILLLLPTLLLMAMMYLGVV